MYQAGVYLRLSREDGFGTESGSIQSQRELALSFVRANSDICIYDFYVDNGYSGTGFRRPGFVRMMRDVEAGLLNCIIVKDLSRFGRNYIEAGRLIQRILPAFRVRFIAIADCFDSLTAGGNEFSLILPVKNFINESYCSDISRKVRSSQRIKRERGEFAGSFTVYGYLRDPQNKGKLIPDPYAAQIVKDIFSWRLSGMSSTAIAGRLNRFGILSPMEYKKSRGENYSTGFASDGMAQWSSTAVARILANEVYLGNMVQGKSEKINYKLSARRIKRRDEWICVENTHAPLVAEKEFLYVQQMQRSGRACRGQENPHLFSGLLFCGSCGKSMVLRRSRNKEGEKIYFICSTKNGGGACTRHRISEEELTGQVFAELKKDPGFYGCRERTAAYGREAETENRIRHMKEELRKLGREKERYLELKSGLYEDWKGGVLSGEDFKAFQSVYEKKYQGMQEAERKQEKRLQEISQEKEAGGEYGKMEKIQKQSLSRKLLLCLVSSIYIYENRRIRICFKNEYR